MGALTALALDPADGAIMLVAAPDSVLAEAGAMKPRPSFASTLLTAEPTARLLWWPENQYLEPQTLRRLKWLIETADGEAWLVIDDSEDESPSEAELRVSLEAVGLACADGRRIGANEVALPVSIAR